MIKTYSAKKEDIKKQWYIIDAENKILGRVAAKAAAILRGKHKPIFTPHMDTGDGVVIVNVAKVKVTGRKLSQKVYRRYSGYPGGLREVSLETMLAKKPTTVMQLAVRRMLPGGRLGTKILRKLKVYAYDKHWQISQKPVVLEV